MNYIKILFMAFVASATMTACGDSFLDTEPSQNASEESVKDAIQKDPTKVQGFISGYYSNLFAPESQKSHDDFGLKAIELATDMMGSDMAYLTSHFFVYDYDWDNRATVNRRVNQTWQQLYAVISGANTVIGLLLPEDGAELDATSEYMLGQSYTIRAYCYFWLVNMYQQPYQWNKDKPGIPIYTESLTILNRGKVSDVYTQILSDIDTGYNYLKGKGLQKKSELNEYAAAAIYANILSFVNDYPDQWNEVAKYARIAVQGGTLMDETQLLSGFNDISLSEVLWGADIDGENNTFYASFMSHMDAKGAGYGGDLGNYKQIASDLYDKIADNDIRKKWFGVELGSKDPQYNYAKYVQRKYVDVGTLGTGDIFASDYIYLRTAEMYFVGAEALYMAGKTAEAKQMLEEVMKTRVQGYTANLSGDALLEEIKIQKRIEMWGEGRRFLDMKRRAEPLDRTKASNHRAPTIKEAPANDSRMIYMMPSDEINANDEMSDADQNP
ncbi:RagB/SusD family nutrient uptake outer membrane protein [Dysgonomonas sp. OttesenSCG-928-M03]|nr:RagB/SusD family nutrient uptake outer membrane protein [Dysgonomonas sp. OttesenSCG-928-M03]